MTPIPSHPQPTCFILTRLGTLAAAIALVTVSPCALLAAEAEADPAKALNVDFNGTDSGQLSPTFSGVGALGGGVFWNGLNASFPPTNGEKTWDVALVYSDGHTQSDIQVISRGLFGIATMLTVSKDDPTPSVFHDNALLVDVIGNARAENPGDLSISGLEPNTDYDLVLYGRAFTGNCGTKFVVNGEEQQTTGVGPADIPMQGDRDFVTYRSVNSGGNGEIIVTVDGTSSGSALAGFSIAPTKH